jgi:hypothetical protein
MPIDYSIDPARRLVSAKGRGTLTEEEIFTYQQEVWSRADVRGFNELMDMTDVELTNPPPTERLRRLANFSASMDPAEPKSKFAIVAPQLLTFGLGRMYEAYRSMESKSTKEVAVFRSLPEALAFLGILDETSN